MKTLSKKELDALKVKKGTVVRDKKPEVTPKVGPVVAAPPKPEPMKAVATAITEANLEANARFEILMESLAANFKQPGVPPGESPVKRLHIVRDRKGLIQTIEVER